MLGWKVGGEAPERLEGPLQRTRSCHSRPLGAESVSPQRDRPDLIIAGAAPSPSTFPKHLSCPRHVQLSHATANAVDLAWT
ncbi:hypothetical protein ACRRTK_000100 [Alexandromys fortis]